MKHVEAQCLDLCLTLQLSQTLESLDASGVLVGVALLPLSTVWTRARVNRVCPCARSPCPVWNEPSLLILPRFIWIIIEHW